MIEYAGSFATIVGLLSAFVGGRQSSQSADVTEFTAWLIEHNHNDIAEEIRGNRTTSIGIKALLNQQLPEINEKLGVVSEMVASISCRIEGLKELSLAYVGASELSDQAHSIIEQMCVNEIEFFLISDTMAGTRLVSSNNAPLEFTEPMFIKDDIYNLLNAGLLRLEYNQSGGEMLYITRAAYKLIKVA